MRPGFSGVVAEAGALWRGNGDLLLRIAAVFFFLPTFALQLFLAMPVLPDPADRSPELVWKMLLDWELSNLHWIGLSALVQSFGSGLLLVLLLAPERPRLDEALVRTLRLMPGLILVWLGAGLLVMLGMAALIVPGFYLLGRIFVAGATYVDNPGRGPFGALTDGIMRTRGYGWLLLSITMLTWLVTSVLLSLIGGIMSALTTAGVADWVHKPIDDAGAAAVAAAGVLAQVLLQVAAYRLLTPAAESQAPRRG